MIETSRPRLGARTLFVGAALIIVLAGLKAAQTLVIPFLLALFLAIICAPAVTWLTRKKVPAGIAVLAVVVALLGVFSGFGAIMGGSVNDFTAFASQYQARFDGLVDSVSVWFEARDIDPENLDIIFEKLYQLGKVELHSSGRSTFKGGGPGLGLAIAAGIVKAHGGKIWAESPGYDEETMPGSTFFIRLPLPK